MTQREGDSSTGGSRAFSDSSWGRSLPTDSTVAYARREGASDRADHGVLSNDPAVRNYVVACLAAMVVMLFVLLHQNLGSGSLMPVLVGIMGIVTRWRVAPLMLLGALTVLYYLEFVRFYLIIPMAGLERPQLSDLVLAGAVLVYVAGHYRLQGLFHEIVPREAARPSRHRASATRQPLPELAPQRSLEMVTPSEVHRLPLVTVWAGVALGAWLLLPAVLEAVVELVTLVLPARNAPYQVGQVGLRPEYWRALTLVWVIGVAVLVLSSVVRYVGSRRMTAPEARLFLQDAVWRETRREQSRINRWLAWARARRHRREEAS